MKHSHWILPYGWAGQSSPAPADLYPQRTGCWRSARSPLRWKQWRGYHQWFPPVCQPTWESHAGHPPLTSPPVKRRSIQDCELYLAHNTQQKSSSGTCASMSDLLFLLQRLHLLLVPNELLLHQEVVFDPLLLQQLQAALSVRGDWKANAGLHV